MPLSDIALSLIINIYNGNSVLRAVLMWAELVCILIYSFVSTLTETQKLVQQLSSPLIGNRSRELVSSSLVDMTTTVYIKQLLRAK